MIIKTSSAFDKCFKKLDKKKRGLADKALCIFIENPFDPKLKNHSLKGNLSGVRAISAAYDLRILYTEREGHALVLLLKIGKHEDVY